MRILPWMGVALVAFAWISVPSADAAENHRLGGGAHYWRTIDNLESDDLDIDDNAVAWLASYQYLASDFFKLEIDVEFIPKEFAGLKDDTVAPQALALIGSGLYGGLGIGTFYSDSKFSDDPFFLLRAGIDIEVLPQIWLDINANYHFSDFGGISDVDKNIDTDTVTLGAVIRISF